MATVWGSFAATQMHHMKEMKMGEGKHFFRKWNTSLLCIYVVHDIFRLQEFYLSLINEVCMRCYHTNQWHAKFQFLQFNLPSTFIQQIYFFNFNIQKYVSNFSFGMGDIVTKFKEMLCLAISILYIFKIPLNTINEKSYNTCIVFVTLCLELSHLATALTPPW